MQPKIPGHLTLQRPFTDHRGLSCVAVVNVPNWVVDRVGWADIANAQLDRVVARHNKDTEGRRQ